MDIKMEIKTEPGPNKSLQNRTTPVQFGILISFMEQHQDLAFNTVLDKILYRDLWNELTTHLNSNGPPIKTKDRWMKVWADLKSDIRKKLRAHAGDGKCKRYGLLSAKDERVINLLNLRNPEVTNNMKPKRSPRASIGSTPRPSTSFDEENDSFDVKPEFNLSDNAPPAKVQHMLDYDDDEFDEDDYNDKTSMLECELQNNSDDEMNNTDKVMISASLLKEHIMSSQIRFAEVQHKLDDLNRTVNKMKRVETERLEIEKNILRVKQQQFELKKKMFELKKMKLETGKF